VPRLSSAPTRTLSHRSSETISRSRIDLHVTSSLCKLYVGGNLPAVGEKRIVIKGIFKPSMLQK
jgi:hypothetical protein